MNYFSLGLFNGLTPVHRLPFICPNAELLSAERLGKNVSGILIKILFFINGNAFQNIVYEIVGKWSIGLKV